MDDWLPNVLEIALAMYSVVVFATLAGMLGAFFLERQADRRAEESAAALHSDDPAGGGAVSS